jgi:general secretion pathway protein G
MPTLQKAFSLIELIFVIAVLGIIATVAIPKLMDTRSNAQVSTIKQDISTITSAVQSYYLINGSIAKISDAVNINGSVWNINDTKVEYKVNNNNCVKIEVSNSTLIVDINENSTDDNCKKLLNSGIKDITYDL